MTVAGNNYGKEMSRRDFLRYAGLSLGSAAFLDLSVFSEEAEAFNIVPDELKRLGWTKVYFDSEMTKRRLPLHEKKDSYLIKLGKDDNLRNVAEYVNNWVKKYFAGELPVERVESLLRSFNDFHGTKSPYVRIPCQRQYYQKLMEESFKEIGKLDKRIGQVEKDARKMEADYKSGKKLTDEQLANLKEQVGRLSESDFGQNEEIRRLKERVGKLEEAYKKSDVEKPPECPDGMEYANLGEEFGRLEDIFNEIPRDQVDIYAIFNPRRSMSRIDQDSHYPMGIYVDKRDGLTMVEDKDTIRIWPLPKDMEERKRAERYLREWNAQKPSGSMMDDVQVVTELCHTPSAAGIRDFMKDPKVRGFIFGRDGKIDSNFPRPKIDKKGCKMEIYYSGRGVTAPDGGGNGASGAAGCGGSGPGGNGI